MPQTKAQKQQDATERQVARDARTTEQQVKLIATRRGNSAKELKRLRK